MATKLKKYPDPDAPLVPMIQYRGKMVPIKGRDYADDTPISDMPPMKSNGKGDMEADVDIQPTKKYAKGGRIDGCAVRGKTRAKLK